MNLHRKKPRQYFKYFLCLLLFPMLVEAQVYDDTPQPDESFSSFFVRITHGGVFNGIRLDAPVSLQTAFLKRIKKSYWVGARDQVYKSLEAQGINLWDGWFRT